MINISRVSGFLIVLGVLLSGSAFAQTAVDCFDERTCTQLSFDLDAVVDKTTGDIRNDIEGVSIGVSYFAIRERGDVSRADDAIYFFIDAEMLQALHTSSNNSQFLGEIEFTIGKKEFDYGRGDGKEDRIFSSWDVGFKVENTTQYRRATIYLPFACCFPPFFAVFNRLQFARSEIYIRPLFSFGSDYNSNDEIGDVFAGAGVELGATVKLKDNLTSMSRFRYDDVDGNDPSSSGSNFELGTELSYRLTDSFRLGGGVEYRPFRRHTNVIDDTSEYFETKHSKVRFSFGGSWTPSWGR